jgi:hypothetical protein
MSALAERLEQASLLQMSPVLPVDDETYRRPADAERFRQALKGRVTRGVSAADLPHLALGELCHRVPFALGRATLPSRIGHVVSRRPNEEVRGIAAGWVIAVVSDQQPIGDGAVVEFPGDPMGEDILGSVDGANPPVTPPVSLAVPLPTGEEVITSTDVPPEPLAEGERGALGAAWARAVLAIPEQHLRMEDTELLAACGAGNEDRLTAHRNSYLSMPRPRTTCTRRGGISMLDFIP